MELLSLIAAMAMSQQLAYDGGCMVFGENDGACIYPQNDYEEFNVAVHRLCLNSNVDSVLYEDFSVGGACGILSLDPETGEEVRYQFPNSLLLQ